ncbi:uncharacterized protein LOC123688634 [Harmonia axyridis]|uniref:uncharacterized protein LOC123688634 n=1 Tax=Harmonia axyridis TaxID=115357 RepID=UPI001E279BFF|nr:uncharacterized protein LOC123688634 [Harmonia axyridis]
MFLYLSLSNKGKKNNKGRRRGNGSRDFMIRCLKRSFTNDMAELCSWTGQKDNYKVADSPVMKILHSAVKKTTGVFEKDFEIYVKDWLRHAKQRKERMLKKKPIN